MTDRDLVLARMRIGIARLRLLQAGIEEAAVFLKAGRVSPFGAVGMLKEAGAAEICDFVEGDTGFRLIQTEVA